MLSHSLLQVAFGLPPESGVLAAETAVCAALSAPLPCVFTLAALIFLNPLPTDDADWRLICDAADFLFMSKNCFPVLCRLS
jgi:hypothetical protein